MGDLTETCIDCDGPSTEPLIGRRCRPCARKRANDQLRKRRAENPELIRAGNLWRLYKIRPAEYDAMRAAQDYRCSICQIHEDDVDVTRVGGRPTKDGRQSVKVGLHVDHDHTTGAIRALLCSDCNRALASLREDPRLARAAADYLERHAPPM